MHTRPSPFVRIVPSIVAAAVSASAFSGDFCFTATPYEVQHYPSCVEYGDFNGDGSLDLVVANHEVGQDTVSLLLNNGDGTFGAAVHYPVPGRPYWLGVGDVDGDGDADLVVSNFYGHSVAVLLNDGSGTLGLPTEYFVGFFPTILALAHLDADSDLDIAVAVSADATAAILLGNGDGTFARAVAYPVSLNPYGITAADFDGDGALDLAVANYDDASPLVSLLKNNGDGTFVDQGALVVADAPVGIASGDLDGSGLADLVVTVYGATAQADQLAVYLNDGAGGFGAAVPYTVSSGPYWVDLADLDGDSDIDIVTAATGAASDGMLAVLLGDGAGAFGTTQFYEGGSAPGCIAAGDLDGNSSPELVSVSYGDHFVFVLFNQYPAITANPVDQSVAPGDLVQFRVAASGAGPFTYQWRRDGVDLTDDGRVTGAGTDTLSIDPVVESDAGVYDAIVTNDCGSLPSAAAQLLILARPCPIDPDIDGGGGVNGADLALLLGNWGACRPADAKGACCTGDLNGDGEVGGADLAILLGSWGS